MTSACRCIAVTRAIRQAVSGGPVCSDEEGGSSSSHIGRECKGESAGSRG